MANPIKHAILPFTIFLTGACVLIVELLATRVLSPFYGNTIYTISSVIGVILAALSLGYSLGGRLADRYPSFRLFFGIILLSGVALLAFHLLGKVTLPMFGYDLPLTIGPLVISLLLFFFPAFFIGTLSPFAFKLQSMTFPNKGLGRTAGGIFFWSTLGSIVGTLLTGFILIPYFGIDQIMVGTAVLLFLLGLIPLLVLGQKRYLILIAITFFIFINASQQFFFERSPGILYDRDGVYERIKIYNGFSNGRPARFFQQDRSNSGSMFLDNMDPSDLTEDYTKYYSLYKLSNTNIKSAFVIGGGAYSIPKAILAHSPQATVDVAEIEPTLYDLAKKYFRLTDDPRLHNHTDDGRRLLHDSDKNYDLIFSDVYYSLFSIPAHFTTQEFFKTAKSRLSQKGVFVANLIGDLSRQSPSLIMSEIKTFQSVFPKSYFFAVQSPELTGSQNIIFAGFQNDATVDLNAPAITNDSDPIIRTLRDNVIDLKRFNLASYPILTDDYSPVEYLTGQVLQRSFGKNNFFDGEEMLGTIGQILAYGPRYPTAKGHKDIQDFIVAEMGQSTHQVTKQTWQHTDANGQTYELTNIIARLYPEQKRRIILATHYDSQKISFKNRANQDQPSPGADNSASGVAVLLELAQLFANYDKPPSVGIDFVFFDGEEGDESQGGDFSHWKPFGSIYFADHLNETYKSDKPISGVDLDMVCDKDLRIPIEPSSQKNAPSQTAKFWDIASRLNPDVFPTQLGQEIYDDHTSLTNAGIPSFLVIDYDYPFYATTDDTLDKCSAKSLQTVAEAVWEYSYQIQ